MKQEIGHIPLFISKLILIIIHLQSMKMVCLHFVLVSRRVKLCGNFFIYQMSIAENL